MEKKPEARYDIIDKILTMMTIVYAGVLFLPIITSWFSNDLALIAILAEIQPDAQFFNIWLILVGALTGKQIQKLADK